MFTTLITDDFGITIILRARLGRGAGRGGGGPESNLKSVTKKMALSLSFK